MRGKGNLGIGMKSNQLVKQFLRNYNNQSNRIPTNKRRKEHVCNIGIMLKRKILLKLKYLFSLIR